MGKRIICILFIFGILSYGGAGNVFAEEWLGVFTTDTYPVDGCKIVKANGDYTFSRYFRNSELDSL